MRTPDKQLLINEVKRKSYIQETSTILEDINNREFIRYDNGRVTEYDRTRCSGQPIRLTREELKQIEVFDIQFSGKVKHHSTPIIGSTRIVIFSGKVLHVTASCQ